MDTDGNSEARIGWGTGAKLANAQGVLTALDEVTNIGLPEETSDDVEVTHYKSPGKRKEYISGLIESGEGSIELNYIPGSPTDVLIRAAQGQRRAFEFTLPDEAGDPAWIISGFLIVKGRSRAVPIGDRLTATVSVRYTGAQDEEEAA